MLAGLVSSAQLGNHSSIDVDQVFRDFGTGSADELMILFIIDRREGMKTLEFSLSDVVSNVCVVFTESDGRPSREYLPSEASKAFYKFGTKETERWKGVLHMILTIDRGYEEDLTLIIRHGEDGVQVMEDPRFYGRVFPKVKPVQPRPSVFSFSKKPPFFRRS